MDQKMIKQLFEEIREIRRTMVTKDDAKSFATKDDLKNFATKDDLLKLENRLHNKIKYDIDNAVIQIGGIVEKRKADRTDVEALSKRVTLIERKFAA